MLMDLPATVALDEQDTDTLHRYMQYLHGEMERTQAVLRKRGFGEQTAFPKPAVVGPVTNNIVASQERFHENPYRAIVDDQLDPICRFQADFRLTFVNEPYAALYGKAPQELIGKNLLSIILPAYRQQVITHLASLTAQHPVAVDENPVYLADGSVCWFHWTNRFLTYADGTIEYQGVGRDITKRKQAEEAERKQRQLAEAMRDSLAALTRSLDVEQVMTQILTSAATVIASDAGRIEVIKGGYLKTPYLRGYPPEAIAWFNAHDEASDPLVTDNPFCPEKAYIVADTQQESNWFSSPPLQWIRSSIGVPIRIHGEVIGVLVADSATPHYFKPADVDTLQTFANYAALALTNAYQATLLEQRVGEQTDELYSAEAKFQQLFEAAPVAILVSNQAGQITLVNHQAEALFGYQAAELLQQFVAMLVPEANRADPTGNRTQFTAELQQHAAGMNVEAVARRKDGSHVPVEIQVKYIQTTDERLIMSFILDITERKQAADALQRQRDFLQSIIDHMPLLVGVKNRQGTYQLVNQHAAKVLGTTPSEVVGKTTAELDLPEQQVARSHQATSQVFNTQQALFIPDALIGEGYYQVNIIPLPGPTPADDLVLVVSADITEQKQSEAALQQALQREKELSELKSAFITTTSHEFRTPLAIILSTTDTLRAYRHKLPDEQIEQRLTRISSQVKHLKRLLEDVLDLSRLQARRFTFTPVPCDPAQLCRQFITEFQESAETKRPFVYTCDAELPLAELDERLLRHILNNLLSNAMKYSADDQPVAIHLARYDNALILTVSDKGRGIPAADIKHLFQPFSRATNVETIPGVGLGLSIIKEAVELHCGSITVESQVGVGTTFTVTFPLAVSA